MNYLQSGTDVNVLQSGSGRMVPLRNGVFMSAVLLLRAALFLQKINGFKQPNSIKFVN